jgi:hypothetical protein
MALASGWLEPVSSAAAKVRTSASEWPKAEDIGDLGLAFGQRAGLVERNGVDGAQSLQHRAALQQQAAAGTGDSEAAMAAGVEITRAQGQPISRMARPL